MLSSKNGGFVGSDLVLVLVALESLVAEEDEDEEAAAAAAAAAAA